MRIGVSRLTVEAQLAMVVLLVLCAGGCTGSQQAAHPTNELNDDELINELDVLLATTGDNIQASQTINQSMGLSSRVVSASDCGVRGPRFESRR